MHLSRHVEIAALIEYQCILLVLYAFESLLICFRDNERPSVIENVVMSFSVRNGTGYSPAVGSGRVWLVLRCRFVVWQGRALPQPVHTVIKQTTADYKFLSRI